MTDPNEFDPTARELRASLERHAREAPRGDLLAERIINQAERPHRGRGSWRTWSLPLVAAGAVAAVVGAIVGVESLQSSANGPTPATGSGSVLATRGPQTSQPTQQPSVSSAPAPTTQSTGAETLHDVNVLDLTFVGLNQGWALAAADCVSGPGRCSALFHMKGANWWSMPNSTPFNVDGVTGGCTDPCVTNIRFADPDVGYAFGPSALYMTTDGGHNWKRQDGGAIALESLDGNVIRVTATSDSGCPGPCGINIETASIGSTHWSPSNLPELSAASFAFGRGQPSNAYLLIRRNPAGGAQVQTSTLYRSTDNGVHWTSVGEPCPQAQVEVDSVAVTGGDADRVAVLCARRQAPQLARDFVAASSDGGATFSAEGAANVPQTGIGLLTGDPGTVLIVTGDEGLARSTNGGQSWHSVPDVSGPIGFVGFESTTVGRAVSTDGKTIWTTRDGGKSWAPTTFG